MLALIGFAAVAVIVGQNMHVPTGPVKLDAAVLATVFVLVVIAPLTWFAINAIRPLFLLPIVGLAVGPIVAYYYYVQRSGGAIGLDLLYGAVIPNIPFGFILWAGLRGLLLTVPERAITQALDPGAGYWTVLRFTFGVWPELIRSRVQAALSGVLIYGSLVFQGLSMVVVGMVLVVAPGEVGRGVSRAYGAGAGLNIAGVVADVVVPTLITLAIAVVFMLASAGLRILGRMASRQSLENQVGRDPRPPILFLRAFSDDQATLPRGGLIHRLLRGELGRRRLDHVLVEEFSRFGPVVALGRPGQRMLPFGAARIYVEHDGWQAKVLELAEESTHVVMVADEGSGVAWEIETMLSPALRPKTIFLVTERLGDLRASAQLRPVLDTEVIPPAARVIGSFQSRGGHTVVLHTVKPSLEAHIVALQAFFRRDSFAAA
jgi:hypothetical protein